MLAIARERGFEPCALSFRYGQRHVHELTAADVVARSQGVARHVVAEIDLRQFGGSALTADIEVPKGRTAGEMAHGIPITYVPARNTVFLSFALAWAETLGSSSTRSTTPATRTAGPSTSPPSRRWPTWRRRPASKARSG